MSESGETLNETMKSLRKTVEGLSSRGNKSGPQG